MRYSGPNSRPGTVCVLGKYTSVPGPAACKEFSAGKYNVGSHAKEFQTCQAYSQSTVGSDHETDCYCNTGYTEPNGGACPGCLAGKYKVNQGSALCTDCPEGQYSTAVCDTSNVCETCPVNTHAPARSNKVTKCTCNAGWTGPDSGMCSKCVPGKCKTVTIR